MIDLLFSLITLNLNSSYSKSNASDNNYIP